MQTGPGGYNLIKKEGGRNMVKVDRKKLLNEPDEFQTFSELAVKWGQENKRIIAAIAIAVVIAVGSVVGIRSYLDHRAESAANAMAPAFLGYNHVLQTPGDAKVMEATEKDLAKVVEEYGATPSGMQARLALGNLLLEQEKWDEAAKHFNELCEEPDLAPELMPLAWHGLGKSLEAKGEFAPAAEAYEDAIRASGPNQAQLFRLDLARALAAAGQTDKAVDVYQQLLQAKIPDMLITSIAQARLVELGAIPQTLASQSAPAQP